MKVLERRKGWIIRETKRHRTALQKTEKKRGRRPAKEQGLDPTQAWAA
jgi:hypothetical protein